MRDDFTLIGEIINGTLADNPRYKFAIKCSTLFSLWEQIVGPKFAKFSKPLNLNYNKLTVVCKNPVVAQELTMFKQDLLKKISKFCEPLNLKITDFVFSYKNWGEDLEIGEDFVDSNFVEFNSEEINDVEIQQSELDLIFENVQKITFLDNSLKEKYYSDIVNSLKAQKLRAKSS